MAKDWQADELVGGDGAWLIIEDTALPKKGKASAGVAPRYASARGKNANCQTLVSVTLASGEVPVMLSLRLFLPVSWTSDVPRMEKAGVPIFLRAYRTKPEIAIEKIDRVIRPTCNGYCRWQAADDRGCDTCRTSNLGPHTPCSKTRSGVRSVGAMAYASLQSRRIAQARRKKEISARRRNPACQQCAKPFLTSCNVPHQRNALTADAHSTSTRSHLCQSSARSAALPPREGRWRG